MHNSDCSLLLDFQWHTSYHERDFHIFAGNLMAYTMIKSIQSNNILIYGPKLSGKTHLSNIFQSNAKSSLTYVYHLDHVQLTENEILMILYNTKTINLWLSSYDVCKLFALSDLHTRFNAMLYAYIDEPDEDAFMKILAKRLRDYGLHTSHEVLIYITHRIDTNYASIENFIQYAHTICMNQKLSFVTASEIISRMNNNV